MALFLLRSWSCGEELSLVVGVVGGWGNAVSERFWWVDLADEGVGSTDRDEGRLYVVGMGGMGVAMRLVLTGVWNSSYGFVQDGSRRRFCWRVS